MNRFFADWKDGKPFLNEDSLFHLRFVLRARIGEKIEIVTNEKLYRASIRSLDPFEVDLLEEVDEKRETGIDIYLGFSLLKGGHDELVIQKGTELGVKEFFPFYSERTIILLKDEKEKQKRLDRFQKIAFGACEQSKRINAVSVHPIVSFSSLLSTPSDHRYIAYEAEAGNSDSLWKELPKIKKGESIFILVGPEGGFSEKEVKEAISSGFKAISLGRRILRAETASIAASSLLGAYGDEL